MTMSGYISSYKKQKCEIMLSDFDREMNKIEFYCN